MEFPEYGGISSDGTVDMTLVIPTSVVSRTRSGVEESKVSDLSVFVFKGNEDAQPVAQYIRIFSDPSKNSGSQHLVQSDDDKVRISFRLNDAIRQESGLRFYFVANAPSDVVMSDIATFGELKAKTTATVVADGLCMMSGEASYSQISSSSVALVRNAAKISVTGSDPMVTDGSPIQYYPYAVFGSAKTSLILNSVLDGKGNTDNEYVFPDDLEDASASYVHPTANAENSQKLGGNCFIVVKAEYQDNEYFYRLDFYDKETKQYIVLKSNHWYQFIINEVTGEGYATPEEASKHPESRLMYDIHDHCPRSYNMASDGFRELGVTHRIDYSGHPNSAQEGSDDYWSAEYVYIRFFSKDASELPEAADVLDMIAIEDPSWLKISKVQEVTNEADHVDGSSEGDPADAGRLFRFALRFNSSAEIGTLENKLTVSWKGLSRDVPIVWRRSFNGAEVSSVVLTMDYNQASTTINDYWAFLTNAGADNLWGIQAEANNGKLRNQGFHFPVMYGEGGDVGYASYAYDVKFDQDPRLSGDGYDVVWEKTGDPTIKDYVEVNQISSTPLTLRVTRNSITPDDYTYGTGALNVKVTFRDSGEVANYAFALYHTGFFHKDSQIHRMDVGNVDANSYYYYEVVPFMMGSQTRYMLDRNLGAKSAEMYVRDSDGDALTGNQLAAGGYYKVAKQLVNEYVDPVMFDSESDRVSPPGYTVPSQREWDYIRNSSSFHTESVGDYFTAYYDTGNPAIGRVYFPKSMFYYNGNVMGESRAGYYWTCTAATGTEKEEIGKWLKMLNILGNATSYSNGCVEVESDHTLAYGASVRCVNDIKDVAEIMRTSFNVSGATHVFLYSEENGVRIPTTTWPGHPIGNYATMKEGWFGFKYESSDVDPEDLRVIFNFMDERGIIHTYSQDASGNTVVSTDKNPTDCIGWKVIGDVNTNLIPSESIVAGDQALVPAMNCRTELGNWWRCSETGVSIYDAVNAKFRVYWPIGKTLSILDANTGEVICHKDQSDLLDLYGYYSYEFFEPNLNRKISIGYDVAATRSPLSVVEGTLTEIFGIDVYQTKCIYLTENSHVQGVPKDMRIDHLLNNPVQDGFKRIYMVNVQRWPAVKIWYWSTIEYCKIKGYTWPGPYMYQVKNNETWLWYYDVEEDTYGYIFNHENGSQSGSTGNQSVSPDKDVFYTN